MVSTGVNRSILIVPQAFDCTPMINMETTYYILYIFLGASTKVAVHNSGELRLLRQGEVLGLVAPSVDADDLLV